MVLQRAGARSILPLPISSKVYLRHIASLFFWAIMNVHTAALYGRAINMQMRSINCASTFILKLEGLARHARWLQKIPRLASVSCYLLSISLLFW